MLDKYKAKTSYKILHKDLTRLHQKYQQLNKSKSRPTGKEGFERFMTDSYQFPQYYSDDALGKSSCSSAQNQQTIFLHLLIIHILRQRHTGLWHGNWHGNYMRQMTVKWHLKWREI